MTKTKISNSKNSPSKIPIIFENEFLLIAEKPPAMLSVPSRLGAHEKRPILKKLLETQTGLPLWSVHRLDFEVGGLILFAKTAEVHRTTNGWFEKQMVEKTYTALSEGSAESAASLAQPAEWRSYIVRGKKRAFAAPYGQEAITIAQYMGTENAHLKWELYPKTGRGHQLRYELSSRGFPIVGDKLYGAKSEFIPGQEGIALKAVAMNFTNCVDHQKFGLLGKISL